MTGAAQEVRAGPGVAVAGRRQWVSMPPWGSGGTSSGVDQGLDTHSKPYIWTRSDEILEPYRLPISAADPRVPRQGTADPVAGAAGTWPCWP
jgi:hypothetical protein